MEAWPGSFGAPRFRSFLDGSDSHLRSEPRTPVLHHFLGDRAVRCQASDEAARRGHRHPRGSPPCEGPCRLGALAWAPLCGWAGANVPAVAVLAFLTATCAAGQAVCPWRGAPNRHAALDTGQIAAGRLGSREAFPGGCHGLSLGPEPGPQGPEGYTPGCGHAHAKGHTAKGSL